MQQANLLAGLTFLRNPAIRRDANQFGQTARVVLATLKYSDRQNSMSVPGVDTDYRHAKSSPLGRR